MKIEQCKEGASMYQKVSTSQQNEFKKLMSFIEIKKGWKILDIGCGTGNCTVKLAEMVGESGQVIAIDPIEIRIEEAKSVFSRENIHYHVAMGQDCSKFGQDFDLVVIATALHWITFEQQSILFESINKCLKPGGRVVFNSVVLEKTTYDKLISLVGDEEFANKFRSTLHCHSLKEFKTVASEHGFIVEEMFEDNIISPFDSFEIMSKHFAATMHTLDYNTSLKNFAVLAGNEKRDQIAFAKDKNGKYAIDNTFVFAKWLKFE